MLSDRPGRYLFVYVDLALLALGRPESNALDARVPFFRFLFSKLNQVVQDRLEKSSELKETQRELDRLFQEHYHASTLHELVIEGVDQYLRALEGLDFVIVLLLDEADAIVKLGVGHMLRALIEDRSLAYVIATQRPLHELDPEAELSPLYNLCTPIRLGLLEQEDAQALVTETAARVGHEFSEPDLQFIRDIGGCHPDFIKIEARHVFDERLSHDTPRTLDYMSQQISLDLEAGCRTLWESLAGQEKQVVLRIAGDQPLTPDASLVADRLAQRGIVDIRASGKPRLFSRVFKEYVQDRSRRRIATQARQAQAGLRAPSSAPDLVFGENYFSFNEVRVPATQQELRLLKCMYEHVNQVCSRRQLYEQVWDRGAYTQSKAPTVNIAVQRLRDKLKTHLGNRLTIEAERGQGYRLILHS